MQINLASSSVYISKLWCLNGNHLCADLKTISKRIESEQYYITLEMFLADVRRMFANARTYNSPHTIYYKCATRQEFSYFNSSFLFFLFFLCIHAQICSVYIYITGSSLWWRICRLESFFSVKFQSSLQYSKIQRTHS